MAKASMPLQYERLYAGPLDITSVFDSYDEAVAYSQSPTCYVSQVIGVTESSKSFIYIVQPDKTLKKIEDGGTGGGVEEAPIDDKQYVRINATWREIVAGSGSLPTDGLSDDVLVKTDNDSAGWRKIVRANLSAELQNEIDGKIDSNQGTIHYGKFLGIGIDGMVVPTEATGDINWLDY